MRKIVRRDWTTSIDLAVMTGRDREAIDEANRWSSRKRRARRARRGFLRRLKLWGR